MLDVRIFFKALALFTATAFIIYAVTPTTGIDFLLKLIALDIGLAILMPFAYPSIRGVRSGDAVLVLISESGPFGMLPARSNAIASSNGRVGSRIKVKFRDGSEEECVVVSYASMFTPAKVKILEREIRVV